MIFFSGLRRTQVDLPGHNQNKLGGPYSQIEGMVLNFGLLSFSNISCDIVNRGLLSCFMDM